MPFKKKINDLFEKQKAEIEGLRRTNESLNEIIGDLLDDWASAIKKAKSEAIKEVTAELYNSFRQYENYDRHHTFEILERIESVEEFLLNNLVKEMTEVSE